jgi:hypothetical protein
MSDNPEPYFRTSTPSNAGPEETNTGGAWMGPRDAHPLYELAEGVSFRPVFGKNLLLNYVTWTRPGIPEPQPPRGAVRSRP